MRYGARFSPKGQFQGTWLPYWLMRMDINPTSKILYARASNWDRGSGVVEFRQGTMAEQINVSLATVKRCLAELENAGLMRQLEQGARRLHHMPHLYEFLYHEAMDPSPDTDGAVGGPDSEPHQTPRRRAPKPPNEGEPSGELKMSRPESSDRAVGEAQIEPSFKEARGDNPSGVRTTPPSPPADAGGDDAAGSVRPMVEQVWAAYQQTRAQVMGDRYRAQKLTPQKRRLIEQRLRSHGADAVMGAVRGWRHDAWVCGENDKGTLYATLELVLRVSMRGDNVERFGELHDQAQAGQLPSPRAITGGADAARAERIRALMEFADGEDDEGPAAAMIGPGAA